MKQFKAFLIEGRDSPLYHSCSFGVAESIMITNYIGNFTSHIIDGKNYKGVSTTRNLAYTQQFGNKNNIIFVLNQRKLSQNHKIIPIDYFQSQPFADRNLLLKDYKRKRIGYAEAEEFVVGSIKNISRYVTEVLVDKSHSKDFYLDVPQNILKRYRIRFI